MNRHRATESQRQGDKEGVDKENLLPFPLSSYLYISVPLWHK
jgi:hypothetical protein